MATAVVAVPGSTAVTMVAEVPGSIAGECSLPRPTTFALSAMDDNLLSLIVPAFNEARTIEAVLDRVFEFLPDVHEVLVIDDASIDPTPEVAHAYALEGSAGKAVPA